MNQPDDDNRRTRPVRISDPCPTPFSTTHAQWHQGQSPHWLVLVDTGACPQTKAGRTLEACPLPQASPGLAFPHLNHKPKWPGCPCLSRTHTEEATSPEYQLHTTKQPVGTHNHSGRKGFLVLVLQMCSSRKCLVNSM